MSSFEFLFLGWLFASQKSGFSGLRTHFVLPSFLRSASELASPALTIEPTEKVPITAFLSIFSVTLFKNYRKRTLKILRSEVFQWPPYNPCHGL